MKISVADHADSDGQYLAIQDPKNLGIVISKDGKTVQINCEGTTLVYASGIQTLMFRDEFLGIDTMRNMDLK